MKKSKVLSIVFITLAIASNTWTALVVAGENGFNIFENKETLWPTDSPALTAVTRSNGYYNLSFAFTSANYSRELQNIIINPRADTPIAGLMGYINGTIVNGPNPVFKYNLQANDSLYIDIMLPCTNFNPDTSIEVEVMGAHFLAGGRILLP